MDLNERIKPASVVAGELTEKQIIALRLAGKDKDGFAGCHSRQLVFSPAGQIGYGVLRALANKKGLISLHTGGQHGGSHKAYYELSGKGRAVLNFLEE